MGSIDTILLLHSLFFVVVVVVVVINHTGNIWEMEGTVLNIYFFFLFRHVLTS